MKTIKFFIPLLTAIIILSCSDNSTGVNNVDKSTFTYPFTNGSSWNYQRTYNIQNIRPDSIKHYFPKTTITASGVISIMYDTLINSVSAKCFSESYVEDGNTILGRAYYINNDSGLLCLAHRGNSVEEFPNRFSLNLKVIFNNRIFDNLSVLIKYYSGNELPGFDNINDTLIMENKPVMCLSYPITEGKQWSYRSSNGISYINKKYIDFESVVLNNTSYSCIKCERTWVGQNNLYCYDYYSKYGQLYKDYLMQNLMLTNEFGDTLGFFDTRDKVTVTSFTIPTK